MMTAIDSVTKASRWGLERPAFIRGHARLWPGSETRGVEGFGLADSAEPAAVSGPPPRPVSWRLDRLSRASGTSRELARSYLRAARAMAAGVRSALAFASPDLAEARLAAQRDSQLRARKTLAFTVLCRRRAARLMGGREDAGG